VNALFAGGALGLIALALFQTEGHYRPDALAEIVAAFTLALAAAFVPITKSLATVDRLVRKTAPLWLVALVELQLYALSLKVPGIYVRRDADLFLFQMGLVCAGVVCASYLWPKMPLARLRLPLLVAIFVVLGMWMINAAPRPFIDVWYYEQKAAAFLLHGNNPYTGEYPNIYGRTPFIDDSILKNGNVQYHMYTPLSVLATLPGYIAGDARYALVAATAGAALLLGRALRRLGRPAGDISELAAACFLFHARGFFLVEEAWTEPFMVLSVALCIYVLSLSNEGIRRWPAFAVFLSAKQYSIFWLPALISGKRLGWRELGYAVAASAVLALPFFLWGPEALFQGVIAFQFKQPFRWDALSVLVWLGSGSGQAPSSAIGFAAAALVMAVTVLRGRSATAMASLGETTLTGAATYLAFFAFNKQAFFNYYWFVGALLALGMGLSLAEDPTRVDPVSAKTDQTASADVRVVPRGRRRASARTAK
jgi:hypothetical protein